MYSCLGLGCHREFFFLLGRKSRELLLNDIPTIKMLILAHINNIVCNVPKFTICLYVKGITKLTRSCNQ